MNKSPDDTARSGGGGRRLRQRVRGYFSGKKAKTAGAATILAPIVGYVVNDLRKPDSLIRRLAGTTVRKLLSSRSKGTKAIDISDKVDVVAGKDEIEPRP